MSETTLSEFFRAQGYTGIQTEKNAVGHFEVQALVNGVSARLLVDTGASRTVIARASVPGLKLAVTESETKAGGVGTAEQAVATTNHEEIKRKFAARSKRAAKTKAR